jgi:hypothetical protein
VDAGLRKLHSTLQTLTKWHGVVAVMLTPTYLIVVRVCAWLAAYPGRQTLGPGPGAYNPSVVKAPSAPAHTLAPALRIDMATINRSVRKQKGVRANCCVHGVLVHAIDVVHHMTCIIGLAVTRHPPLYHSRGCTRPRKDSQAQYTCLVLPCAVLQRPQCTRPWVLQCGGGSQAGGNQVRGGGGAGARGTSTSLSDASGPPQLVL